MAKRSRGGSLAKYEKWVKKGRGQGEGQKYIPFLQIQDVPSMAPVLRTMGLVTGRVHHLMSGLEANYLKVVEFTKGITDIHEQVPLLPQDQGLEPWSETLKIAKRLRVEHPKIPYTKELIVMTTDFVLHFGDLIVARNCKYSGDLLDTRVQQKIDIERRYWKSRGINFEVVTEEDLPKVYVKNLTYLRKAYFLEPEELGITQQEMNTVKRILRTVLAEPNVIPAVAGLEIDDMIGLMPGTSLSVLRHMLIRGEIAVDMHKEINPRRPLPIIQVETKESVLDVEVIKQEQNLAESRK